jgi:hypothetical protein
MATVTNTGISQGQLYELLNELVTICAEVKTNIAGINAKLDADAGVTDTDYAATWDVTATTPSLTTDAD